MSGPGDAQRSIAVAVAETNVQFVAMAVYTL